MATVSVFGVLLALCVALTSAEEDCAPDAMARENVQKLALANNELAFNLHRKLAASSSSDNVFFSPLSISSAMGMLFYGARGDTAEELRKVLGYEKADLPDDLVHEAFSRFLSEVLKGGGSSDPYVLDIANAVLVDEDMDLIDDYKSNVQELYKADVRQVDFARNSAQIVREINEWVKEKTKGKIEKLFDSLSPSTIMVLLNAVYFKGTWKYQFETRNTAMQMFYNNGLQSGGKSVSMMHMTERFPYTTFDDFKALELPYKGENVSMLVLLPNQRDGISALESSMTPEKLSQVQQQMRKTKVVVSLPKFKFEYSKELSPAMRALGANDIFGAADFSGMTHSRSAAVSQIMHKAVIEVNEEGSEAAAVTGIVFIRTSVIVDRPPEFNADHPFLFAIIEKGSSNNMILFLVLVSLLLKLIKNICQDGDRWCFWRLVGALCCADFCR
ncbi:uncharacterized serpin-like protein TK1782 [Caerostris extrusa]|uniref:Uncharacterized serpin-like protein TK1782 n=1 Tax=Caerostris extrusa TaxID=172846 RepID=A0AAV4Q9G4_CAEEX|nr:uncharacterized serpin-like protein TK1782 [Caerostris extrusa]